MTLVDLALLNILCYAVIGRKDNILPSKFTSKGENTVEMMAGFLPMCLGELTGFPVTAKDSVAFDLPVG